MNDLEQRVTELTKRIESLESRYAFAESTVEQLNDVIVRQQKNIEQLQHLLGQLTEMLKTLPLALEEKEPPPHY